VAVLMQGESVLLFWGNDQSLWLASLAVIIMAGLLVRLGLAHFEREYLLGREFDSLNPAWMWKTFWKEFRGEAKSLSGWYRLEVVKVIRQSAVPITIMLVTAILGYWASYHWAVMTIPKMLSSASTNDITNLVKDARQTVGLAQINQHLSAVFIFTNNLRATLLILIGGMISFSVLGMIAYLVNVGLVGVVLGVFKLIGFSPLLLFAAGLLPHGIFEIPALMLSSAVMLRIGAMLVTPQIGKSMGQVVFELLADWLKVFLGVVVPLLAVAALIETYVTPFILVTFMK
jgi:uncharacterized membrane protein SpoIIM required for sporulation